MSKPIPKAKVFTSRRNARETVYEHRKASNHLREYSYQSIGADQWIVKDGTEKILCEDGLFRKLADT